MAEKIHFDLVSPERMLLSEDVDMVTLPVPRAISACWQGMHR